MSAALAQPIPGAHRELPVYLRVLVRRYGDQGSVKLKLQPDVCADIITDPGYHGPNRHLNPARVERYARTMREGRWQFNGEAIKFDTTGALVDGQHRLHAAVSAELALTTLVVWGLAEGVQDTMDTGKVRSAGDVLSIRGYTGSTTNLAAAARLLMQYEAGAMQQGTRGADVNADEVLRYVRCNPDVAEVVQELGRLPVPVRLTVYLAAYTLFRRVDPEAAARFNVAFVRGAGLERGNPILTLRDRFLHCRAAHDRLTPYIEFAALLRTWNSWRKGDKLARVLFVQDGLPIVVPERLR